ncbi:hypothetical protein BBJ28_00022112, partial [Nothophytophthora sp. Chile5]
VNAGKRKRGDGSGGKRDDASKKPRVNRQREAKDAKFGFGGKRRHAKSNTKESSNDMSRFPGARAKAMKARIKAQAAPKGGKRAGKDQRANQRSKNRR